MDLGLEGKRAIVAGGTRGIGLCIAEVLAAEGARIAVCGRDQNSLDAALETLAIGNRRAFGASLDVRDAAAFESFVERAAHSLGGLDIFVACASAMAEGDSENAFRSSFEVDLLHVVRGCGYVTPWLEQSGGGSIALIGTASAVLGTSAPEERAYATLKAAIVSFGGQLAQELAPKGIRVNCIQPGAVLVPDGYWDTVRLAEPDRYEAMRTLHPLRRLAAPREIAGAVAFLVSPAASFITGSNLRIDGGMIPTVNF